MGGVQQGVWAVVEVKKTASTEHPASAFPTFCLSFCANVCVETSVYLEKIGVLHLLTKYFTCTLQQMC